MPGASHQISWLLPSVWNGLTEHCFWHGGVGLGSIWPGVPPTSMSKHYRLLSPFKSFL